MTEALQVDTLIETVTRLSALLEREIGLLRERRPLEIEPLQAEKAELTALYEQAVGALRAEPDFTAALDPALRNRLARAVADLEGACAANAEALRSARQTTERLVSAIAEEIRVKRPGGNAYSRRGAAPSAAARRVDAPVSLTFDSSV